MGLLQTPRKLDCLLGTEQNGNSLHRIFFRIKGKAASSKHANRKRRSSAICALDGPLSAFELLVDNSMFTHVQQRSEAEVHRVRNSDEWKLSLSKLKAFISLLYVRGALCGKNRPIFEFWDKNWGIPFFQKLWVKIAFAKSQDFFNLICGVQDYFDFKLINLL